MTGAAQHRAPCPHIDDRPADLCMTSKVTTSNAVHFVREGRVVDVDASDLRQWVEAAEERDATVVVCNSCRHVLRVDGDDVTVLAEGKSW